MQQIKDLRKKNILKKYNKKMILFKIIIFQIFKNCDSENLGF